MDSKLVKCSLSKKSEILTMFRLEFTAVRSQPQADLPGHQAGVELDPNQKVGVPGAHLPLPVQDVLNGGDSSGMHNGK
jgi:hypothetical protein